jgi:hypothetical protein
LGITFDKLLQPTATPLAAVLRGPFETLEVDDLEELFNDPESSIYRDDGGADDDAGAAGDLPEEDGFPLSSRYGILASLASATDVDQYVVRAPQTASGLAVLTATVRGVGPNGATPRIEIFNRDLSRVPATILVNDNATFTIQAVDIPDNDEYILRVADTAQPGNYALDVSFLLGAATIQTLSAGSLNSGEQLASTLYVGRSQAFGIALSTTGPAGATVQLTISDAAGRTVFLLAGPVGDTVTGPTTLLAPGEYALRITATGPSGVVDFSILGDVITDPVGPQPVNSVAAPQYQDPVQPTGFLYPNGTQTFDPYLWLAWFPV